MVKLTDRDLIVVFPIRHPVICDVDPAVIPQYLMTAVSRINPQSMVIDMHIATRSITAEI